jgi:serine/threonine protein kinase
MKQVCLLCERTEAVANLWCQELYCPAEMSPYVLDYGEWLGDIEIVRLVMVLRTAVLYEATHQGKKIYLKVAHPGEDNKERLKREAQFLFKLQEGKKKVPTNLPTLLPPYAETTLAEDNLYGRAMLREQLLYFYMFKFVEGYEPLRDVLNKNPQLWVNHIGWLMLDLDTAVQTLNQHNTYHLALSPETILVRFDDTPERTPRILLYDFGVASPPETIHRLWRPHFALPAYTPPELINGGNLGTRTEVYAVGLILYELLIGEPAYTFKLRSDDDILRAISNNQRLKMTRYEDVRTLAQLAEQTTATDPAYRLATIAELHTQLINIFGAIPPYKQSRWPRTDTFYIITGTLLIFAFLIALAISLSEAALAS